jgi:hypothetical protein
LRTAGVETATTEGEDAEEERAMSRKLRMGGGISKANVNY